jgi:hypothetical protein
MTLNVEYCYSVSYILSDMFFIVVLRVNMPNVDTLSLIAFSICLFAVIARLSLRVFLLGPFHSA